MRPLERDGETVLSAWSRRLVEGGAGRLAVGLVLLAAGLAAGVDVRRVGPLAILMLLAGGIFALSGVRRARRMVAAAWEAPATSRAAPRRRGEPWLGPLATLAFAVVLALAAGSLNGGVAPWLALFGVLAMPDGVARLATGLWARRFEDREGVVLLWRQSRHAHVPDDVLYLPAQPAEEAVAGPV